MSRKNIKTIAGKFLFFAMLLALSIAIQIPAFATTATIEIDDDEFYVTIDDTLDITAEAAILIFSNQHLFSLALIEITGVFGKSLLDRRE